MHVCSLQSLPATMERQAGLAYAIFLFIGIGASLPWNVFITAEGYFQQRLAHTRFEESFLNWFSMAFNITTLSTMFVRTVCIGERMPGPVASVFAGLVVISCVIFGHSLITKMPQYAGDSFFQLTMASIMVVSMACTALQDGLLRMAANFPPQYTQAIVTGQALAGLGVSVSNFLILFFNDPSKPAPHVMPNLFVRMASDVDLCAFVYFTLVFVTSVLCLASFVVLTRLELFQHYQYGKRNAMTTSSEMKSAAMAEAHERLLDGQPELKQASPELLAVAFRIRLYAATVFFVFLVTLAVFPGITSSIQSMHPERGRFFRDLFAPFSFILFNFGDLLGRLVAPWCAIKTSRQLLYASLARLLFFPLLMLCNVSNEHHQAITTVVFRNDLLPVLFLLVCALTNGLFCTLALMHYPGLLRNNQEKEMGGTIMFFVISIGLCAGSLMSFVLQALLKATTMASKLEYLQRYMSGGDADKKSRKKEKKKKKAKSSGTGTHLRVVDDDPSWDNIAPNQADIDEKWERDGVEDERPVVVAGTEEIDPQDLPVFVNADEFKDELQPSHKRSEPADVQDASPPRRPRSQRARADSDDSPARRGRASSSRKNSTDDFSPPRRRAATATRFNDNADDASPPRRRRGRQPDSDDDMSPPRRGSKASSPAKQRRKDSEDVSPPRRQLEKSTDKRDEDASPPRRRRKLSTSSPAANSPVQAARRRQTDSDVMCHRARTERVENVAPSGSDRAIVGLDPDPDRVRDVRVIVAVVVTIIGHYLSDEEAEVADVLAGLAVDRNRAAVDRQSALLRRTRDLVRVLCHAVVLVAVDRERDDRRDHRSRSPIKQQPSPRKVSVDAEPSPSKKDTNELTDPDTKPRGGLYSAQEFTEARERHARNNDFQAADADAMGANAETVYRDKRGRKLDMLNELVRQQEVLEGKRQREAREEYEWGTGNVQKVERQQRQQELEEMKSKPFARHEDDAELEQLRKERVRAFDPINSKVFQDAADDEDGLGGSSRKKKKAKKAKKSSSSSNAKTSSGKSKYAGPPAPPNRFSIPPGYRWDGVVRGTNWEEKVLLRHNKSAAGEEDAYKYAVADM
ncbi:TPA: LOW QUALITY PROTEIN: hypothetical protein N0F65_007993 [Lagenidium giganteum]|uniref:Pre-mRNA-splicing factor CWC26 n=1 Tax=Lagenidium giganteum TaxID=4803 RepID=A0AAV2YSN0_9STRA|nr:TPA: LOW QUALITY PROTEIN: hypothetical protein N0F65_007993 [Lagenidium giganteum]